eukprot:g61668.t1
MNFNPVENLGCGYLDCLHLLMPTGLKRILSIDIPVGLKAQKGQRGSEAACQLMQFRHRTNMTYNNEEEQSDTTVLLNHGQDDDDISGEDGVEEVTLDEAITRCGFGRFQYQLILVCGLGYLSDAAWPIVLGDSFLFLKEQFSIDDLHIGSLGGVLFTGMMLGSLIWGNLSDRIGRKPSFLYTLLLSSLGGLLAAGAINFYIMLASMLLIGAGVGGNLPVDSAMFAEMMPSTHRGKWLTLLSVFWPIGGALTALLAWVIFANCTETASQPYLSLHNLCSQEGGWRLLLISLSTTNLLTLALRRNLPESPHYLLHKGLGQEAARVVMHIARLNGIQDLHCANAPRSPSHDRTDDAALPFVASPSPIALSDSNPSFADSSPDQPLDPTSSSTSLLSPHSPPDYPSSVQSSSSPHSLGCRGPTVANADCPRLPGRFRFRLVRPGASRRQIRQQALPVLAPPAGPRENKGKLPGKRNETGQLVYPAGTAHVGYSTFTTTTTTTSVSTLALSPTIQTEQIGNEQVQDGEGCVADAAGPDANNAQIALLEQDSTSACAKTIQTLRVLFSSDLRRTTILLWTVWFSANFGFTSINLFFPLLLKRMAKEQAQDITIADVYGDALLYAAAGVPGSMVGAYLVDSRLGRKWTMFYATALSASFLLLITQFAHTPTSFLYWNALFNASSMVMYAVLYTYTPEVYPTPVRAGGSGLASAMGRLASIIAPYVAMLLQQRSSTAAVSGASVAMCFSALATAMLPLETRGLPLDVHDISALPAKAHD